MAVEIKREAGRAGQDLQRAGAGHVPAPWEDMERMFERFMPRGWLRPGFWELPSWSVMPSETKMPTVDVIERDDEVLVRAELPGVEKKDIDISASDSSVTIRASTHREEKEEKGDYVRHEISSGSFARTVVLPSEVDIEKSRASFKDGLLELAMPKVAKARRRAINVD